MTAAAFKRAFERAADPRQAPPATAFLHSVVGADARAAGRASSLSGVVAKGQKLTIKLTQERPDVPGRDRDAVLLGGQAEHGDRLQGDQRLSLRRSLPDLRSRAGRGLTVERNRFYRGNRPANADRIVFTTNTDLNQSLLQVQAGQVDYDAGGSADGAPRACRASSGSGRAGTAATSSTPGSNTTYLALNTSRPAFGKLSLRKAVNYAVDRPAMLRVAGKYAGKRSDQILPPNMRGFRDARLYPIKGADPAKARQLGNGAKDEITVLHTTSSTSIARAQIIQYNLRQMGLDVKLKPQPFAVAIKTAGARGSDFDMFLISWFADYPDPFDFINVLLDGNNIQGSNNSNYAYLNTRGSTRRCLMPRSCPERRATRRTGSSMST